MTLGSLFDGIGGFPLAAGYAGIKTIWASEIEKVCVAITSRHFPQVKHLGDITKIKGDAIEPVDIISFGSPCQDLSVAGKRAGLEGQRSGLFMQAIRIIKEMRIKTNGQYPTYIIWENVPGAFSSNKGEDFKTVLEEISGIAGSSVPIPRPSGKKSKWLTAGAVMGDCFSVAWRVMDAQYWGVPQRRRRIFLIADLNGQCAPKILFKCQGMYGDFTQGRATKETTPAGIKDSVRKKLTLASGKNNAQCLTTRTGQRLSPWAEDFVMYENHAQDARLNAVNICPTLTSRAGTGGNNLPYISKSGRIRRLTPTECERLQGFPEGWTEKGKTGKNISDSARYRALGNSVAIPCVRFIFEGIIGGNDDIMA